MTSCDIDSDCLSSLYPYCVSGTCEAEDIWEYSWTVELGVYFVFGIIAAILASSYPLRDGDGVKQTCLSILLAFFAFWLYLLGLIYQNPRKNKEGGSNWLCLIILYFVFWPAIFCYIDYPNENSVSNIV